MDTLVFQNIIISIVLGLLIGLQREMNLLYANRQKDFGGARTFALISLIGYLSAWISNYVPYLLIASACVLGALLIGAYILNRTPTENGMTTEFSALVVFLLGALLAYEKVMLAVFVAMSVLFVLNLKDKIQTYEKVIEKQDLSAAILFLMMSFVILPLFPDEPLDPWGYFNLYNIWLMVVLVAGISFLGYIAVRVVGTKHGIGLAGLLGGLVSSTAVALSLARRSKENPSLSKNLAIGVALACSIMLFRIFVEIYIINAPLAKQILVPVLVASMIGYAYLGFLYYNSKRDAIVQETTFKNPFQLSEALILGLLFGAVIALIKYADTSFGDAGVYVISFISGLSDTDAIALSLASLSTNGLTPSTALNALLLAIIANSLVKFTITMILGTRTMVLYVGLYLVMTIGAFVAMVKIIL